VDNARLKGLANAGFRVKLAAKLRGISHQVCYNKLSCRNAYALQFR
jgi:hypothetical protein